MHTHAVKSMDVAPAHARPKRESLKVAFPDAAGRAEQQVDIRLPSEAPDSASRRPHALPPRTCRRCADPLFAAVLCDAPQMAACSMSAEIIGAASALASA